MSNCQVNFQMKLSRDLTNLPSLDALRFFCESRSVVGVLGKTAALLSHPTPSPHKDDLCTSALQAKSKREKVKYSLASAINANNFLDVSNIQHPFLPLDLILFPHLILFRLLGGRFQSYTSLLPQPRLPLQLYHKTLCRSIDSNLEAEDMNEKASVRNNSKVLPAGSVVSIKLLQCCTQQDCWGTSAESTMLTMAARHAVFQHGYQPIQRWHTAFQHGYQPLQSTRCYATILQ